MQLPEPGKLQADSFGSFLPNTAFSSLDIKTDVSDQCRYNSYSILSNLVGSEVTQILNVLSLADMAAHQVCLLFPLNSPFLLPHHFLVVYNGRLQLWASEAVLYPSWRASP